MKAFLAIPLIISFTCSILFSCGKKEILGEDIKILNQNRNLSTVDGTDIYTTDLMIEPDTSDTLRFKLTDKDWAFLRKSFDKNKIYLINNDTKIGERANSIEPADTIIIKTNNRSLSINYRYFLDEKENIDTVKTKSFKGFMHTFDSLVYYRSRGK
ncbi:hypothetical protein C1637_04040 [Chryseobacterium lactis]|uniref:Lipoprotein n=1 Tax=Chryseobacterium lactis TaxID=1241981 RepID=A0A3G6RPD3_CHRLC|nr:hypothetical protein [Chryseobacterium lactis]AZA81754.1 hypothetical protein EG342_07435 [Chryseobacterium lactis]AZB06752.1 hypothetical protein EG341_23555 [Chryseobacterium lactis]PNW15603.1 hypothetical protein C1637_04040 [Chryseobacterium lactis]